MMAERNSGISRFSVLDENILVFDMDSDNSSDLSATAPLVPIEVISSMQKPKALGSDRVFFVGAGSKLYFFSEGNSAAAADGLREVGVDFVNIQAFGVAQVSDINNNDRILLNSRIEINSPAGHKLGGEKTRGFLEALKTKLEDYFVIE